jgi:pilus assembly protein CpaF
MRQFGRPDTAEEEQAPDQRFQKIKADVHRVMVEALDLSQLNRWPADRLRREVQALAVRMAEKQAQPLTDADRERLTQELMDEAFGLGPLEGLLHDPHVSDILVNGPDTVYIERGGRLEPTGIHFADNAHLMRIIQRIASRVGRRVDESSPMVDARLPDGSRVNAVVPPLALDGPVLSIRRFVFRPSGEELLAYGTLPPEMLKLLQAAVAARTNTLISGGTGAGKTTLLNALSHYIPSDERLVTIEDAVELQLQQPHVVRMETRPPNLEGIGEVTQRHLVRNALRMRPDRIIIGEVRGAESLDMLQAMNTGHEGSLTTIHANDTRDALARLEMMVSMAGFDLPVPVIRNYIAMAIPLVVHIARLRGGARKVVRISEIVGLSARRHYRVRDIFTFNIVGVKDGHAVGTFAATGYVPRFLTRLIASGYDLPPEMFDQRTLSPTEGLRHE